MSVAPRGRDAVAIILAIGVATAVNIITLAVLLDALLSEGPGLSENATQILTGAFGAILGVLGSFVGYHAGVAAADDAHERAAVDIANARAEASTLPVEPPDAAEAP